MPLRVYIDISDPVERRRVQRDAAAAGWLEVSRRDDADIVVGEAQGPESDALSERPGPTTSGSAPRRATSPASPLSSSDDDDLSFGPAVEALTARELQVLRLLAEGLSNRDIADRLGVSEHTVKFHLSAIFGKLGASTRTDAVRRALRSGLIDL